MSEPNNISWEDFLKVEFRAGTIIHAEANAQARKPAYVLKVDLGELGVKTSSAQIADHYLAADLVGKRVLCVCNFPPKRVAGVRSEVLVTGVHDEAGRVMLAEFPLAAPNGGRLM
ncbi:tRNA-binding protein [Chromobacterium violaceum]|uniref:tRNA-binding protein n=1 Tax=Chromobacterium violaceum TaxID=536 RepID=UPI0009DAF850|nr:tRNA-binding protein [Chromobacterium violaceum]OQS28902.1 tRNA-binding protein [Chromobacterium violaceum]